MPFEMDGWGVDVAVTGSQKGLMTLPGLGFVAAGPKAMAAHKTADLRTRYWDWTERGGAEHYQKYYGTPPDICRSACARRWTSSSPRRSEEHTSELQSLMRNSYAVFCLKKN